MIVYKICVKRIPAGPALERPRLEIKDLELVVALAETGSTVAASPRLHLTQSAISRALLSVEDRLGAPLFVRRARGLSLTPAGERLVTGARTLLAHLAELEHAARGIPEPVSLRLVCECYTAYRWLPSTLAELERAGVDLKVTLSVEHTQAPVDALRAGAVDVALLTTGRAGRALCEAPLFSDQILFLLSRHHPLAERAALTREDLLAFPLITSTATPEPEARWFLGSLFGRGRKPTFLKFPLTEAIVDAARAGLGVAVLSEWVASPYLSDRELVLKPLLRRKLERPWRIACRPEHVSACERLAQVLSHLVPHSPMIVERRTARVSAHE